MKARGTYGSKLAGGFGLSVAVTLVMVIASVLALTIAVAAKDEVISNASDQLVRVEQLNTTIESRIGNYRAFLLGGTQKSLDLMNADRARFLDQVATLRDKLSDPTERALLATVSDAEARHATLLDPVVERRKSAS
jgi:CHASE3 domain sensor protein